jgi:heme-binding protein
MSLHNGAVRRLAGTGLIASALGAAALFGAPLALANEDPAADPPNCTAADLEGVRAGVSASTSAYLFTHPDLNDYITSLRGLPRQETANKVKAWLAQHPQEKADMAGIRQPLADIRARCAAPPSP